MHFGLLSYPIVSIICTGNDGCRFENRLVKILVWSSMCGGALCTWGGLAARAHAFTLGSAIQLGNLRKSCPGQWVARLVP